MKSYANFDTYLVDQPRKSQAVIRALRAFVRRVAPHLQETVKWGNGCWVDERDKTPIAYMYTAKDYVQFGFNRGSSLKDPRKLLHGEGQYVRHIKVYKKSDIDERAFSNLLKQACKLVVPKK